MNDRDKPRRARSHWGDERRAAVGRQTPRGGIPVEIDPEQTPPPCEPPRADELEAMPLDAQVRALRDVAAGNNDAIRSVWDLRHVGERLDRVERAVHGYTQQVAYHQASLDQWVPVAKECIARIDHALNQQGRTETRLEVFFDVEWPKIADALDDVGTSLRDLASRMGRLEANQDRIAGSQVAQAGQIVALEVRVTSLEISKSTAVIRADERRRIFGWAQAGLVGLGAVVTFLVTKGPAFIAWLTR